MTNQSNPSAAAYNSAKFEEELKAQRDKARQEANAEIDKAIASAEAIANHKR